MSTNTFSAFKDDPTQQLARSPGQRLEAMRQSAPLVQNITNYVAMNVMANVLIASGAAPAMVHAPEEAAEFVAVASALTINIGTLSRDWVESMTTAAAAAQETRTPWVLDPVAVGVTGYRNETCLTLLEHRPTVVRGNASEIMALASIRGLSTETSAGRGVDAGDTVDAARGAALALAAETGGVVAVSGPVDLVTDGNRVLRVGNGHPLMPQVTALGCALNGIVAAFISSGNDTLDSTAAALAFYGSAGALAARQAAGPGSFAVAFIDQLASITPNLLDTEAVIYDGGDAVADAVS